MENLQDQDQNQDPDQATPQPAAQPEQPNKPNYIPASQELLDHLAKQQNQPKIVKVPAATPESESQQPDATPLANEIGYTAPAASPAPQTNSTPPVTAYYDSPASSFRPPQEIVDSLTDDQIKFINSSSWSPYFGLFFALAQNSLRWSLLFIFVPLGTYVATDLLFRFIVMSMLSGQINLLILFALAGAQLLVPILFGLLAYIILVGLFIRVGRRVAWESHYWDSFESYQHNMNKWGRWAKRYVILNLVIIVGLIGWAAYSLSTRSTDSVGQPGLTPPNLNSNSNVPPDLQDRSSKDSILKVRTALEECYTAEATNNYAKCDSINELVSGKYLSKSQQIDSVEITPNADSSHVIAFTELVSEDTVCSLGEGQPYFYVYDSSTGQMNTRCGGTPRPASAPTPTPSSSSNQPLPSFRR